MCQDNSIIITILSNVKEQVYTPRGNYAYAYISNAISNNSSLSIIKHVSNLVSSVCTSQVVCFDICSVIHPTKSALVVLSWKSVAHLCLDGEQPVHACFFPIKQP